MKKMEITVFLMAYEYSIGQSLENTPVYLPFFLSHITAVLILVFPIKADLDQNLKNVSTTGQHYHWILTCVTVMTVRLKMTVSWKYINVWVLEMNVFVAYDNLKYIHKLNVCRNKVCP